MFQMEIVIWVVNAVVVAAAVAYLFYQQRQYRQLQDELVELKRYQRHTVEYDLVLKAFRSVADANEVPGTAPENCGHYLMHNLAMAKWYAREFASYLEANAGNSDIFEYPGTERPVTGEGQCVFDS